MAIKSSETSAVVNDESEAITAISIVFEKLINSPGHLARLFLLLTRHYGTNLAGWLLLLLGALNCLQSPSGPNFYPAGADYFLTAALPVFFR